MSYVITAIISMALGGIIASCFALKAIRAAEKKAAKTAHDAYNGGRNIGYSEGYKRGKALQRVDVAPGVDSVRGNYGKQ